MNTTFPSTDITVLLLSGGKSSRMGADKGMQLLHGKPMIEHMLEKAQSMSPNILILTNDSAYETLGYPCLADDVKDCGPLGGICTGLQHSTTAKNLVLGCDMPLVAVDWLKELVMQCLEEEVLVTMHEQRMEPLCAVYDKQCLHQLKNLRDTNQLSLMKAIQSVRYRTCDADMMNGYASSWFFNINSPQDLQQAEKIK